MKYWMTGLLALSLVSLLGTSALADRMGVGVGLAGANLYSSDASGGFSSLYFPLELDNGVIIEPELSYAKASSGDNSSNSVLALGLGLLFGSTVDAAMAYGGIRGMMVRSSDGYASRDSYAYVVAPVFGGQYWLSSNLSLGVEGRLNVLMDSDSDSNVIYTSSEMMARYFF